jgi:hypothetical protein
MSENIRKAMENLTMDYYESIHELKGRLWIQELLQDNDLVGSTTEIDRFIEISHEFEDGVSKPFGEIVKIIKEGLNQE